MNDAVQRCRCCEAPLNPGETRGLCPACLLATSLTLDAGILREDSANLDWPEAGPATSPESGAHSRRFGDYELLEEIGRGGMGLVYRARQLSLNRQVAVKTIRTGPMISPDFALRFHTEARAAALLDHPNIVPIYEVGNHQGQPFYSMRLIQGRNLALELKEKGPMPPSRAAELVIAVARAVHYAHEHGVLHRDLKPANILLDPEGLPYVADFGLAKLLENPEAVTLTQGALGTPNYMAPELAAGGTPLSTIAVDVYGLGAVLYHALTGKPPFEASSTLVTLRRVLDSDLARPRAANPGIPADIEAICLKAMNRLPESRYGSAGALADDLTRFVRSEPVLARPITRRQRILHWARRNPMAAGLSGIVTFLALALLLGTPWALWRINAERYRAVQRADEATEQRARAEANLRREQVARIEMLFQTDRAVDAVALLGQLYAQNPEDGLLAEWIANELTHRNFALPLVGPLRHPDRVSRVAFSPDGGRLLTVCRQNSAQVWDLSSGRPLGPPLQHQTGLVDSQEFLGGLHPIYAEFDPSGNRVATASVDNTARIWDAATGSPLGPPLQHPDWVTFVRFSPDGALLATGCKDGLARLWNAATGEAVGEGFRHAIWVNSIVFAPDGQRIVTAADDKTARVWAITGKPITGPLQHENWVRTAVFSPDGKSVATASSDKTARIWDAETGAPRTPPLRHDGQVTAAQFSPDGRWLATCGFDHSVRLWRVATGELQCPPIRHRGIVRALDFSPDGLRIVTASEDHTARVWDVRSGSPLTEAMRHSDIVWSACFSPDGTSVATGSSDRSAFVWDVRPGKAIPLAIVSARPLAAHWTDRGRKILSADSRILVHDADSGELIRSWQTSTHTTISLAKAANAGAQVFIAHQNGEAGFWEVDTGRPVTETISHGAPLTAAALAPDGKLAATASRDGQVKVWSPVTGREVRSPLFHPAAVTAVEFAPGGRLLATACADLRVRLFLVPEGTETIAPLAHEGAIRGLKFSPDGRRLVTACHDGTARVWDAQTGRLSFPPIRHQGAVQHLAFSPDGRCLVTASQDGSARLWLAATGQPLAPPVVLGPPVLCATFSPDGRWLALGGDDGSVRVWDVLASQPLLANLRHSSRVETCQFSPNGLRLAAAAVQGSTRVWDLVKASGTPPEWLPELVDTLTSGQSKPTETPGRARQQQVQALRSRLLSLPASDAWNQWVHWFLSDRLARKASPLTDKDVASVLYDRLDYGSAPHLASFDDLIEAVWIQPKDGDLCAQAAIALALGAPADNPDRLITAEWLTRRAERLPATAYRIAWARASCLELSGDLPAAAALIDQRPDFDCQNTYFWLWCATLLEKTGRFERGAAALASAVKWSEVSLQNLTPELLQKRADYLRRHGLSQ